MKRSVNSLIGYTIGALDGEIGKVREFYFDDNTWTIRYLIVETGSWLSGRKVLIAPEALYKPEWESAIFPVNLTKEQVKNSPDIDTEKTVSRQQEMKLYDYYPWTNYWEDGLWSGDIGTTGMVMPVPGTLQQSVQNKNQAATQTSENSHLRSTKDLKGYSILAVDGEVGDVEDFIIDDDTRKLSFLVIDTGNWLPGKKVLLFPDLIKEIKWETSTIVVNATVNDIKNSPVYDHHHPLKESYESDLSAYYDRN